MHFTGRDERVYSRNELVYSLRRMRLLSDMNSFTRGDEIVYLWRRTRLLTEMNSFTHINELVYSQKQTRLLTKMNSFALYIASDLYCTIIPWHQIFENAQFKKRFYKNNFHGCSK